MVVFLLICVSFFNDSSVKKLVFALDIHSLSCYRTFHKRLADIKYHHTTSNNKVQCTYKYRYKATYLKVVVYSIPTQPHWTTKSSRVLLISRFHSFPVHRYLLLFATFGCCSTTNLFYCQTKRNSTDHCIYVIGCERSLVMISHRSNKSSAQNG